MKILARTLPWIVLFLSCNIFNPLSSRPSGNDAKIEEAKKEMEAENYQQAIEILTAVIGSDSSRSEAYYLRGKATLRKEGIDLISIWNEISPDNPNSVPFLYQPGGIRRKADGDTIKDAQGNPLRYPLLNAPAQTNGPTILDSVFTTILILHKATKNAYNDLSAIEALSRAGKSDNVVQPILYRFDYGIESFLTVTLELLADYDKDGWVNSAEDKRMYGMWCNPAYADFSDIEHIEIDSIKTLTSNPNKINEAIDSTLKRINGATLPSIDSLKAEFRRANNPDIDSTIVNGFENFARDIRDNISQYRYNDTTDNDSDWFDTDHNGAQNRMVWIDYYHDGLIDVDSSAFGWFAGDVLQQGIHIGDTLHWKRNPGFYEGVKDSVFQYTPENFPITIAVRHFKRYIGPASGEWIKGDWGVDEEKMDGKDNDCDSRIDEDSRIVQDTLDDDGDWWDTNGNGKKDIMIWKDSLDRDGRIDIGPGHKHLSIRNAITLNPELYVLLTMETFLKRPDLQGKWPKDKDGRFLYNGKTAYIGPYNGEFTSGDFGIDEEVFDGFDNDDDGFADEDVSKVVPDAVVTY